MLMEPMNESDGSGLDARLLQLLLTVLDTGSVTAAAQRLGVTQSAVSHGLDRLRAITGDQLFVKAGRGIVATARAEALAAPARELLGALERFARLGSFDPARWQTTFTIAANDFQRDLLLPALAARLRMQAPGVVLRVIPSAVPRLETLRSDDCQLAISPRPPEGSDIVQKRLFEDQYRVFYDPAERDAPRTEADYLAASHATVVYEPRRSLELDQVLAARALYDEVQVLAAQHRDAFAVARLQPQVVVYPQRVEIAARQVVVHEQRVGRRRQSRAEHDHSRVAFHDLRGNQVHEREARGVSAFG